MPTTNEAETVRPRRMPRPTPLGFAIASSDALAKNGRNEREPAPDLSMFDDPLADLEMPHEESVVRAAGHSGAKTAHDDATVRVPVLEGAATAVPPSPFDRPTHRAAEQPLAARAKPIGAGSREPAHPTREVLDFDFDAAFADSPPNSGQVETNDALALVGRHEAPPAVAQDPLAELRERYALGDFSGALTIAETILEGQPELDAVVRYAESCRGVLQQMYAARLGPLGQVPLMAVPTEQLRWLTLDHRSGFLLSHVDGVSTLEEILDVAGMPSLEAMRILCELVQQRVIVLQ